MNINKSLLYEDLFLVEGEELFGPDRFEEILPERSGKISDPTNWAEELKYEDRLGLFDPMPSS